MISSGSVMFIIRLVVGGVMIYYGWPKVRDLKKNARWFAKQGFIPGWLAGDIVAFTEFVGGIAMIAGIWPTLVAVAFGFQMITGFFWKKRMGKPFSDYSYDLQLLALCLAILVFGGGAFVYMSFDYVVLTRWDALIAAVIVGFVLAALAHPKTLKRRAKKA